MLKRIGAWIFGILVVGCWLNFMVIAPFGTHLWPRMAGDPAPGNGVHANMVAVSETNPPATDEENFGILTNYLKAYGQLVVWLPGGQREVWTLEGDTIEVGFYTGSGPLSDPPYDPGTVFMKIEDNYIQFGSKNYETKEIEWITEDDFGLPIGLSRTLARAVEETYKGGG